MSRRKTGAVQKSVSSHGRSRDDGNMLEALKLYESKNYKKSLKILDAILKKNGTHVSSLALKGLNLFFVGQKKESEDYIHKAISKTEITSTSPICCHILGIYFRQVKKYAESIIWFQASLDNGSTNMQIYKDLATLQSQEHNYKALLGSRKRCWEEFMGYRSNWTALAVAYELNGQNLDGINILQKFESLAEGKLGEAEAYEHNECLLYKNDLLYKNAGDEKESLEQVLKDLDKIESEVFDKYSLLERRASIYMKLGRKNEASKVYRALIKRNPDNFKYYKLLEASLDIQDNNRLRKALYDKFKNFYPKADPPKFMPLTFVTDKQELTQLLSEYIITQLKKGVPSTFGNIKPLYKKKLTEISCIVEDIVLKYFDSLVVTDSPLQFIWTSYFLSQHYLFLKNFAKANEYIDNAIVHTPTMVELYILKARILKHEGSWEDAALTLEEGRKLDLQDRFINTKTAKYFLRANMVDKAVEIASIFTKIHDALNGVKDLHLMEASWFIVEQAEAYYRLYLKYQESVYMMKERISTSMANDTDEDFIHKLKESEYQASKFKGLSLKRFLAISSFYKQFYDDQLDFHSYCMRKGTPRVYVEMLTWCDHIFNTPIFVRAIQGASRLYFSIYDDKKTSIPTNHNNLAPKNNKKAKKDIQQLNRLKEDDKKLLLAYSDDDDVLGESLISTKTPLKDFNDNFYQYYTRQVSNLLKDYILEFQYQLRLGKLALCLGALNKFSEKHGRRHAFVGVMALALLETTKDDTDYDPIAKKVVIKGLETQFPEIPLTRLHDDEYDWMKFLQDNFEFQNPKALPFFYCFNLDLISRDKLKQMIVEKMPNNESFVEYISRYSNF